MHVTDPPCTSRVLVSAVLDDLRDKRRAFLLFYTSFAIFALYGTGSVQSSERWGLWS